MTLAVRDLGAEGILRAMRPLIGIPPCLDERGRWRPTREYHYADAAYARAVAEAGGIPVYLPQQGDVAALAERLDGLLLPGGGDFAPERAYPSGVAFDLVPARQLAFDRALLAAALERDRPVLGICYGMQLLALHCGGALHFDVATDVPGAAEHRFARPGRAPRDPRRAAEPAARRARRARGGREQPPPPGGRRRRTRARRGAQRRRHRRGGRAAGRALRARRAVAPRIARRAPPRTSCSARSCARALPR